MVLALVTVMAALPGCGPGGGTAGAGSCPGSPSFPQRYTQSGTVSTHIQFVETGCSVGIASIEVYTQGRLARKLVFNPPLPAGSLTAKVDAQWNGNGSFRGTAQISSKSVAVSLVQEGTYKATATMMLTEPVGGPSKQWAASAKGSTELSDKWSAAQATGAPDQKAWVPSSQDGTSEWLELSYAQSVIPTGIQIWESNGPGFITKVEAFDQGKKAWTKLWEGTDPTKSAPRAFSPALSKTSLSTNRIRLTIDTNLPGWNEIAAVALIGASRPSGHIVWVEGEWAETGKETLCLNKICATSPMTDAPSQQWTFAFNTATGKVGATPDQVS